MRLIQVLCLLGLISGVPAVSQDAAPVQKTIDLLKSSEAFQSVLSRKNSQTGAPEEAFDFREDGKLRITGKGWGYLRTKEAYRDYHLVAEFKWGEHTYGVRADGARDCGIFVHVNGTDGAFKGSWAAGAEVQLLESVSGNISFLQTRETPWTVDGKAIEGDRLRVEGQAWDPEWKDVKGWHTRANEIESNFGYWNRIEVICEGDSIRVILNGQPVNEVKGVSPGSGRIAIQSELAECWFRRLELFPIGKFTEKWEAEALPTDTGYTATGDSILPRDFPLSPEKSRDSWEIDGNYELQLIASEPLVCDPVDVVWDERGRMYVAEMRDYPLPADAGEKLSRIRLLSDEDGDGIMDKAVTWADDLDHVQGLLPMTGGILATTRTSILFLRDVDGDGVAEIRKPLFEANEPRHNQLQVSSPRWGVDNLIYLNNGLDLKEIYPAGEPDKKLSIARANLSLNPRTMELQPVSGYGQFGATQDDWGRRFACSNRNPVMFSIMPLWAVNRNPFDHITQGHVDVAPSGEASKVYPFELSHTTSIAHAGTHTAACGLGIYRGDLMPDLNGNVFVPEPTAQLITRSILKPTGGSLVAERVGEKRDFLVSSDEWSRPVNVRNGPDGAFYICDMYRRFIDHARFFPEEFSKAHYMRAGFDQGRIYRLAPKGSKPKKIEPLPEEESGLVGMLGSKNAWNRIHAQRLLIERQPEGIDRPVHAVFESSELPQGRLHAMWTLDGLGKLTTDDVSRALNDPHPGVVENAIPHSDAENHRKAVYEIAESGQDRAQFRALLEIGYDPSPETTALFQKVLHNEGGLQHPSIRDAILTGSEERAGEILAFMLENPIEIATGVPPSVEERTAGYQEYSSAVAARGNEAELARVLDALAKVENNEFRFAFANGMSEGLRKTTLKTKSLAAFIASPPEACAGKVETLKEIVDSAEQVVVDESRPDSERLAAIPLASQQAFETYKVLAEKLIAPTTSPAIQQAAVRAMSRFNRDDLAEFFYARWDNLSIPTRRNAVTLLASGNTLIPLMKKMKAGEINPQLMEPIKRWSYGRSKNEEIKQLALDLYGKTDADRAKLIAEYREVLESDRTPNLENGKAVLTKAACITCHRIGGEGVAVGPDLADVKVKPPIAILTDILDPNRAVEERWVSHTVTGPDGTPYTGIITGDDNTNITIKMPGGLVQTIPRDQVQKIETTGVSLMPIGLEGAISKEDMADMISFLKAR
ncbi:MAG: DUF1080 domain-containing protein [Verrucomicrobiales bacterium]|nr:DUF1080 domain-containing protein [Verrucomicrobiales bacterium]